jgi:hypothetical protein
VRIITQNVGGLYIRLFVISSSRIWAIRCSLNLHGFRSLHLSLGLSAFLVSAEMYSNANLELCLLFFADKLCVRLFVRFTVTSFNLYAPCILYIGQTDSSPPQYAFYIFSQKIYLIIFLDFLSPSSFIPLHKMSCISLMLPFLVHKIFTFYINGVLNCKCPAPGPKG